MSSKIAIPPAMLRRAVAKLDKIASDDTAPKHTQVTAARTILARAKTADDGDDMPEDRPALLLMPMNDRDRDIDEAVRKRVLAGEYVNPVPLYGDYEPEFQAKNALLEAAAHKTLDRLYPSGAREPANDVEAMQLKDAERRRKARDLKRRQRVRYAEAAAQADQ